MHQWIIFVCDVWVSTQCSLDKMLCVCVHSYLVRESCLSLPRCRTRPLAVRMRTSGLWCRCRWCCCPGAHQVCVSPPPSRFCRSCLMRCFCCWLRGAFDAHAPVHLLLLAAVLLGCHGHGGRVALRMRTPRLSSGSLDGRRHFFRWRERVRVSQVTGGGRRPQADGGIAVFLRAGLGGGRGRVCFLRLPGGWVSMKLL